MKSKWSCPFDFQIKFLEIVVQWKLLTGLLKGGFPVIGYSYNVHLQWDPKFVEYILDTIQQ